MIWKNLKLAMFLNLIAVAPTFCGEDMKQTLLTSIRNKDTSISDLIKSTESLATLLANEAAANFEKEDVQIETPLLVSIKGDLPQRVTAAGRQLKNKIVLVVALKGGLTLLSPFMNFFKDAQTKVGFVNVQRSADADQASICYVDLPTIDPSDDIIVLESVLASGGTASRTIEAIKRAGGCEDKITLVTLICAEAGVRKLEKDLPKVKIVTAHVDKNLDENGIILPGVVKDFGARFFGWD
jgi:uracil phosphoribosyltransferase